MSQLVELEQALSTVTVNGLTSHWAGVKALRAKQWLKGGLLTST